MNIKKMRAKFGGLDGETLNLHEGLNIIYRENESGKSTWCAFMRCMLYGIDSTKRTKAGVLPDKIRNMPWDGAMPAGVMEVSYDGEDILIRRGTKTTNAPFREFSAVYSGTENPCKLTCDSCGEALTGASAEVFSRTAFIAQGKMEVDNAPELEAKIASIVSTGDMGLSYSEVDAKLSAWSRKRAYNKSGIIPELIAQQEDISETMFAIERLMSEQDKQEELLKSLDIPSEKIDNDSDVSEDVLQCEENECSAKQILESTRFGIISPREARADAAQFMGEAKRLAEKGAEKYPIAKVAGAFGIAATAAVLYFANAIDKSIFMAVGLFLAMVCALAAVNSVKINKSARDARAQYRALLQSEKITDMAELEKLLIEHEKAYIAWNESVFELKEAKRLWEISKAKQNFMKSDREGRKLMQAREKLAEIRGKISATGDMVELETQKRRLQNAVAENQRQCDEIALARELLAEADRRQQEGFSPRLTALAKQYFCRLTDNRYDDLSIDRAFGLYGKLSGEVLPHSAAFASIGARSLMYLSLRLALAELTTNKTCPIILDDALCSLDDVRMARVLDLLKEISEKRQVILFTCQKREMEYIG